MKFDGNFLVRNAANHVAEQVVLPSGYTFAKPTQVLVLLTLRCNARCAMCIHYKQKSVDLEYDAITNMLLSLREHIGCSYFATFSGGEVMLYKDLYRLIAFCRENDIYPKIITNGYLLNERNCDRLMEAGLSYLSISVDSMDPAIHDATRGMPGTLNRALGGARYLLKNGAKVAISTVISSRNVAELGSMTRSLFDDHGVSSIIFQPVEPTFGVENLDTQDFAAKSELWVRDMDVLSTSLAEISALKRDGYNVSNSYDSLEEIFRYFRDAPTREIDSGKDCKVGTRNFFVDEKGDVRFCWFFDSIGNIYEEGFSARQLWNSERARAGRLDCLSCRKECTIACSRPFSLGQKIRYYFTLGT